MQLESFSIKILVSLTAIASLSSTIAVKAADSDTEIDMSQLTCGEFMDMDTPCATFFSQK